MLQKQKLMVLNLRDIQCKIFIIIEFKFKNINFIITHFVKINYVFNGLIISFS